jgi:hypothetical protein
MPVAALSQSSSGSHALTSVRKPPVRAMAETTKASPNAIEFSPGRAEPQHLLNAREVAARLGVSERWVRDHTTRRSPKIVGVKLGTLMRYRCADVDEFMERLTTSRSSFQRQFGG